MKSQINIYIYSTMITCVADKYYSVSPVEANALYDGQLVPAYDWRLFLTGFCGNRKHNPV